MRRHWKECKEEARLAVTVITGSSCRKEALGESPAVRMEPAGKKHECLETEEVAQKNLGD